MRKLLIATAAAAVSIAAAPASAASLITPLAPSAVAAKQSHSTPVGRTASSAIPAPAAWALMVGGGALLGACARRRSRGRVVVTA